MPVAEVLAEFARQSGAEIRGEPAEAREVTAQFDDVPLGEALYRLLGDQNYALVYGDGGKLRAVRLLGGPSTAVMAAGTNPSLAASRSVSITTTRDPVLDGRSPADRSPAAGAAGPEAVAPAVAGFQRIGEFWLRGDDGASQDAARGELMAIEAEPESRTEAVNLANSYTDAQFAELLRQIAGSRADELASFIASQTRVTELRMKALSVHQVLSGG